MCPGDGKGMLIACDQIADPILSGVSGLTCAHIYFILLYRIPQYFCRPTGGVAGVILFFFLNLNPHKGKTLRQHVNEFDFLGLALLMGGAVCVLIGLNSSETSCVSDLRSKAFIY